MFMWSFLGLENMKTSKYKVNMHCASCVIKIENKLNKMGCEANANPVLKVVKVNHNENITDEDIIKAMNEIGYDAQKS